MRNLLKTFNLLSLEEYSKKEKLLQSYVLKNEPNVKGKKFHNPVIRIGKLRLYKDQAMGVSS